MSVSLSTQQARKLVLQSQQLSAGKQSGRAVAATLSTVEHLGYIQIDTISVVARAHHHTLWARNPRYSPAHLDQLVADKQVFEYWSHAAAYLPMSEYRYTLPRKRAIASGELKHWYERDKKLMHSVRKRIADEGPLMARDFEHSGKNISDWNSKPAKRALENLFMQGELMSSRRENFHKVYDLTERVLPGTVDTTVPDPQEYARYLIRRYLRSNGLGRPIEIAYLLKNTRPLVAATVNDMVASEELIALSVAGKTYYALPNALQLLKQPLTRNKARILSPFDNLVIQRQRMQALFGFDYLIECYVPAAKRQYGYFSLPILWDGNLVARMDCKADRKTSTLHILHLALEPTLTKTEAFFYALQEELLRFMAFNNCNALSLHKVSPAKASKYWRKWAP